MFRLRAAHGRSGPAPELPLEPDARRTRLRRGGPRTPIPLLPIIAVGAGIGVAYVSQSAHATKSTYELTALQAEQQQLVSQDGQLGDELARLQSSERIISAAQTLGMQPSGQWSYVAAKSVQILGTSTAPQEASAAQSGALQQLIGVLGGDAAARP